ncbi:hypothetical protein C8R45DRAFT_948182 [Mycena sanguinolenta]|nr:hypothetical protein C8R45DRAFT_948182 [Mycena sanguinolenta]
MLWPRSLLLLLLATLIHGNIEITNFAASERTDAPLLRGQGWLTLRPRSTTRWTLVRAAYGSPFNAVRVFRRIGVGAMPVRTLAISCQLRLRGGQEISMSSDWIERGEVIEISYSKVSNSQQMARPLIALPPRLLRPIRYSVGVYYAYVINCTWLRRSARKTSVTPQCPRKRRRYGEIKRERVPPSCGDGYAEGWQIAQCGAAARARADHRVKGWVHAISEIAVSITRRSACRAVNACAVVLRGAAGAQHAETPVSTGRTNLTAAGMTRNLKNSLLEE